MPPNKASVAADIAGYSSTTIPATTLRIPMKMPQFATLLLLERAHEGHDALRDPHDAEHEDQDLERLERRPQQREADDDREQPDDRRQDALTRGRRPR